MYIYINVLHTIDPINHSQAAFQTPPSACVPGPVENSLRRTRALNRTSNRKLPCWFAVRRRINRQAAQAQTLRVMAVVVFVIVVVVVD
jgi:hypothetical protein